MQHLLIYFWFGGTHGSAQGLSLSPILRSLSKWGSPGMPRVKPRLALDKIRISSLYFVSGPDLGISRKKRKLESEKMVEKVTTFGEF